MFSFAYNVCFFFARVILHFIYRKDPKYRTRLQGVRNVYKDIEVFKQQNADKYIVWIHAASSGEFEQAKPIIEHLKKRKTKIAIFVTFFSSSGYNSHKNYSFSDCVTYLPLDTRKNAKKFVTALKPNCAIFVRYDLWYNFIDILAKKSISLYCICATVSDKAKNNSIYRLYLRQVFMKCTQIFCVNKEEYEKLTEIAPKANIELSSDTRFDRIISIVESDTSLSLTKNHFVKEKPIIIAGSTWREDEHLFFQYYLKHKENLPVSFIIVPHEPTHHNLQRLKSMFPNAALLSSIEHAPSDFSFGTLSIVIVDSIGKLLRLYSLGDAAYIGGGFGSGIHSTAEPAGYGIPLCGGTKIERSPDAMHLKKEKALTLVQNASELRQWIEIIALNKENRLQRGFLAKNYVFTRRGATAQIIKEIEKHFEENNIMSIQE